MSLTSPTSPHAPIKAVLFDCDGVMCLPLRFAHVLQTEYNINTETTSDFFKLHFTPALLGHIDVADILPPFLSEWGWNDSVDTFLDLWLSSEKEIRDDMAALVKKVKAWGVITGLATNQEARRAAYLRREMGLEELFDHLFISSELGAMKPQPSYFAKVTESLSIPPSQILFIDDQQHYIDAAAEHGWKTLLFSGCSQRAETSLRNLISS